MAITSYYLWILIVTAVLLARTTDAQQTLTDVTVYKGDQAKLECSGTDVEWYFSTKKLFISPDVWPSEKGRYDVEGEYNLLINDAQTSDGGQYRCNTNEADSLLPVNLVVIDSISLTVLPRSFLDVGSTIGVTCRIRYAGPELLSESQDPTMTLTLENTPDFLTNEEPQHTRPSTDDEMHTKTLAVEYTLSDATPGRHFRCRVKSMSFDNEAIQLIELKSLPVIAEITEKNYQTTDSIICSAEGIPQPTVVWSHVSGSMPQDMSGLRGNGQAVLSKLENGVHTWLCTATNEKGTDSVEFTFTVGEQKQESTDDNSCNKVIPAFVVVVLVALTTRLLITHLQ